MSKKIIAVALVVLAVTVLFASCKKEEYKVSHTIEVGTTTVDVYPDEEGNEYVTNVDGDMIPMTTDADGFYDDVEDLFTETTTKKGDKTTTTTTQVIVIPSTEPSTEPSSEPSSSDSSNQGDNTTTTTEKVDIEVGQGDKGQDVIKWEDIRDSVNR